MADTIFGFKPMYALGIWLVLVSLIVVSWMRPSILSFDSAMLIGGPIALACWFNLWRVTKHRKETNKK